MKLHLNEIGPDGFYRELKVFEYPGDRERIVIQTYEPGSPQCEAAPCVNYLDGRQARFCSIKCRKRQEKREERARKREMAMLSLSDCELVAEVLDDPALFRKEARAAHRPNRKAVVGICEGVFVDRDVLEAFTETTRRRK